MAPIEKDDERRLAKGAATERGIREDVMEERTGESPPPAVPGGPDPHATGISTGEDKSVDTAPYPAGGTEAGISGRHAATDYKEQGGAGAELTRETRDARGSDEDRESRRGLPPGAADVERRGSGKHVND